MNQKEKIIQTLKKRPMKQLELAEELFGDRTKGPNIYQSLKKLVEDGVVIRSGHYPSIYSLAEREEYSTYDETDKMDTYILNKKEKLVLENSNQEIINHVYEDTTKPRTKLTKQLEKKRKSPEVQAFKRKVLLFLNEVSASESIRYKLKSDLAKKIDMPFYHETGTRISTSLSPKEIAKQYIYLLISYNDYEFAEELLSWLTKQQEQTLRKLHIISQKQKDRKMKYSGGVMEHPIPINYSKNMLLRYIKHKQYKEACNYIDFMCTVPQIYLTKEEDRLVNAVSKDSMPSDWNWEKDNPYIRYIKAGISEEIYQ